MFDRDYAILQQFLNDTGYELKTTFFQDFSIADRFGDNAIRDTYKRAFAEWKDNIEYITELCMMLNWKSWQYAEVNIPRSQLYVDLYEKLYDWCGKNLSKKDLQYFYRTLD